MKQAVFARGQVGSAGGVGGEYKKKMSRKTKNDVYLKKKKNGGQD